MREHLRNAASTLAHHWAKATADPDLAMNRLGVERLILAYPPAHQCVLAVMVVQILRERCISSTAADAFEDMLFELVEAQV